MGEAEDSLYDFYRYAVVDKPEVRNGRSYYPLICYRNDCQFETAEITRTYRIREDGARIYILKEDYDCPENILLQSDGEDYLLYDYAVQDGDTFCYRKNERGEWETVTVRCVKKTNPYGDGAYVDKPPVVAHVGEGSWVLGIGSVYDWLNPLAKSETTRLNNYRSVRFSSWDPVKLGDYGFYDLENKTDDCSMKYGEYTRLIMPNSQWMSYVFNSETNEYETRLSVLKDDTMLYKGAKGDIYLKLYVANQEDWSDVRYTGECYRQADKVVWRYNHETRRDEPIMVLFGSDAVWRAKRTSTTCLYIITYPDGHRESGKVMIK